MFEALTCLFGLSDFTIAMNDPANAALNTVLFQATGAFGFGFVLDRYVRSNLSGRKEGSVLEVVVQVKTVQRRWNRKLGLGTVVGQIFRAELAKRGSTL